MPTAVVSCTNWSLPNWQPWASCPFADPLALFVTQLSTAESILPTLEGWLAPNERERANRFRQPADRQRFVLGRGLLRLVASRYLHYAPAEVRLALSNQHKPYLTQSTSWHINLTHAGDWIALAVADVPVGIDTETINPTFMYESLLPSTFSEPEQEYIRTNPNPRQAFYTLWTRKEALVKATGLGLTDDFPAVPSLDGQHHRESHLVGGEGLWTMHSFALTDTQLVTFAYAGTSKSAQVYQVAADHFLPNKSVVCSD